MCSSDLFPSHDITGWRVSGEDFMKDQDWCNDLKVHFGFKTYVVEDACKAIDLNGSLQKAWQEMSGQGVQRIQSSELLA